MKKVKLFKALFYVSSAVLVTGCDYYNFEAGNFEAGSYKVSGNECDSVKCTSAIITTPDNSTLPAKMMNRNVTDQTVTFCAEDMSVCIEGNGCMVD